MRSFLPWLVRVAALVFAAPLPAQQAPSKTSPKLLVVISVDQYSADLFNEYRPYYTEGLKRLQEGVVFPKGYQSHAATETSSKVSCLPPGTAVKIPSW